MKYADRVVLLNDDKLRDDNPKFPRTCIVCKSPCGDEEKSFNAQSGGIGLGVEFITTRYFAIPMHTSNGRCAESFTRKWRIERYRGLVMILFIALLTAGSIPLLHSQSGLLLIGLCVGFFILEVFFRIKSDLPVQITETPSLKSSRNFEFEFADVAYAKEFRQLNRQFLAD